MFYFIDTTFKPGWVLAPTEQQRITWIDGGCSVRPWKVGIIFLYANHLPHSRGRRGRAPAKRALK